MGHASTRRTRPDAPCGADGGSRRAVTCFAPLTAYRPRNGATQLSFNKSDGWKDIPGIKLACGQCSGCRLERARQLAVRSMHEAQLHERNCFLTLTYNPENLGVDGSLNPTHFTKFAKRMRYWQGPFRYLQCGEYGDDPEKRRPHHHALIFGLDFFEDREFFKMSGKHKLYRSDALDELWSHGFVNIGELNHQTAAYVARYSMKKLYGDEADEFFSERLDPDTGEVSDYRKRPYITMSLKPGLGAKWLDRFQTDVYPRDEVISGGRPTRPPKYYDKLLERSDPDAHKKIIAERHKNGNIHKSNSTPERLAIREEISLKKHKDLIRTTF